MYQNKRLEKGKTSFTKKRCKTKLMYLPLDQDTDRLCHELSCHFQNFMW